MVEDNMKYVLSLNYALGSADGIMDDVRDILVKKEGITVGNLINTFLNRYKATGDEQNIKNSLENCIKEASNSGEKILSIKAIDPETETYRKIKNSDGIYKDLIDPDTKAIGLFDEYKQFSENMNEEIPYKGLYLNLSTDFIEGR